MNKVGLIRKSDDYYVRKSMTATRAAKVPAHPNGSRPFTT
jgi:hypothetical protein